jgi:hypothetical protein
MKRIDQEQDTVASFSSSSSSSTAADRSDGALEYWPARIATRSVAGGSVGIQRYRHFCGLSLELFAGSVMSSETVLPKAVKAAGLMMPRLNWGYASDASPRRAVTISLERRVVSKQ